MGSEDFARFFHAMADTYKRCARRSVQHPEFWNLAEECERTAREFEKGAR